MKYLGIDYSVRNLPELDPDFIPFGVWIDAYEKGAAQPLTIAIERAKRVFASIGAYLAHTLKLYCRFYDVHHMIVLGRVMSGIGGSIILDNCLRILREEYPALNEKVRVMLPDEKTRRVGQSVAAASLPERRA